MCNTPAPLAARRLRPAPRSLVLLGSTARRVVGIGLTCALLALAACSPPAPREYAGHGEAVEVDAAARTVTLDHGDIPGLMKGMTMTFDVAPAVDLASLAPGTEVDFRLSDAEGGLKVVEIRPVDAAAEGGSAAE